MCNEKYCKISINLGAYIVERVLERILDRLDNKANEFYQMMNYDNNICKYYWAYYKIVDNLESFLQCLNEQSKVKYHYHLDLFQEEFGVIK